MESTRPELFYGFVDLDNMSKLSASSRQPVYGPMRTKTLLKSTVKIDWIYLYKINHDNHARRRTDACMGWAKPALLTTFK